MGAGRDWERIYVFPKKALSCPDESLNPYLRNANIPRRVLLAYRKYERIV